MKKSRVFVFGILILISLILMVDLMSATVTCNGKVSKKFNCNFQSDCESQAWINCNRLDTRCVTGGRSVACFSDKNLGGYSTWYNTNVVCSWSPADRTINSAVFCESDSAYVNQDTQTCVLCTDEGDTVLTTSPSGCDGWQTISTNKVPVADRSCCTCSGTTCQAPGNTGQRCGGCIFTYNNLCNATENYPNCRAYYSAWGTTFTGIHNILGLKYIDSNGIDQNDGRFLCYQDTFLACVSDAVWNANSASWSNFATRAANNEIHESWQCTSTGWITIVPPVCGNGLKEIGEACDDGGNADGDGCSATCTVELGYTCPGSPSVCTPIHGDGIVIDPEQCDDGNIVNGDGCSSTGLIESGWKCQLNAAGKSICTPEHAPCAGTLPVNTSWTSQTFPGTFIQTWDSVGYAWTPASKNTAFNQSIGECYFNCNSGIWNPDTNKCEATDLVYCWDLTTQSTCQGASRTIAINSALDPIECSVSGQSCVCKWVNENCVPSIDYYDTHGVPSSGECILTPTTENNCNKVLNNIIVRQTSEDCKNKTSQFSCENVARLGFFDSAQFIASILLIAGIYAVAALRKR